MAEKADVTERLEAIATELNDIYGDNSLTWDSRAMARVIAVAVSGVGSGDDWSDWANGWLRQFALERNYDFALEVRWVEVGPVSGARANEASSSSRILGPNSRTRH